MKALVHFYNPAVETRSSQARPTHADTQDGSHKPAASPKTLITIMLPPGTRGTSPIRFDPTNVA